MLSSLWITEYGPTNKRESFVISEKRLAKNGSTSANDVSLDVDGEGNYRDRNETRGPYFVETIESVSPVDLVNLRQLSLPGPANPVIDLS